MGSKVILTILLVVLNLFAFIKPTFAAMSFQGGFENAVFQYPITINNWHDAKPGSSYSYWQTRLSRVTSPVRKGTYALKAEVQPGDSYGSSGERAEVYWMYGSDGTHIRENEASETQFYTVSVYLPTNFVAPYNSLHPGVDSAWGSFQQLHGADVYSAPPVFALGATDTYYVQMWSGDIAFFSDSTRAHTKKYPLGALQRGKWVDFVWKIKYAKTFTGTVDVWKRIDGETIFTHVLSVANIPTLQFKSTVQAGAILDAYWRTGYYTSQEIFTRVIYLDSHTRGDSFDEVVATAFPPIPSTPPSPSAPAAKPGDADGDGDVDGIDYVAWLNHFNQSVSGASSGDFNNSGKVDGEDYVVWLNNYGK